MLFSLLTGQFIRNIGDLQIMDDPLTFYHFATAANTAIVLVGDSGIHRMSFDDKNLLSVQQKYFKGLKEVLNSFMA
jgi:histidinol phosphatase-like enzyme